MVSMEGAKTCERSYVVSSKLNRQCLACLREESYQKSSRFELQHGGNCIFLSVKTYEMENRR